MKHSGAPRRWARFARAGALIAVALATAMTVAQLVLVALSWNDPVAAAYYWRPAALVQALIAFEFAVVGGVLARRRPSHRVGWLVLAAGVSMCAYSFVGEYALHAAVTKPGSLPFSGAAAVLSQTIWPVPFALLAIVLLVFPTGEFLSPGWRVAAIPAAAGAVVIAVGGTALLWPLRGDGRSILLAEESFAGGEPLVIQVGTALLLTGVFPAVAAVVVRWRRSSGIERLQLRWLVPTGLLLVLGSLLNGLIVSGSVVGEVALLAGLFSLPAAIAVAVLRYRLYEIDRVISRVLAYALITGVLGVLYAAVVVIPSVVLRLDSNVLVAIATLACAATFVPLRSRVQAAVDRRFNRARYDAALVVQGFKTNARNDVDLDTLAHSLGVAVAQTVQPATIAVWIRGDD